MRKYKETNVCLRFLPSIYLKNKTYLTLAYSIKKRVWEEVEEFKVKTKPRNKRLSPEPSFVEHQAKIAFSFFFLYCSRF